MSRRIKHEKLLRTGWEVLIILDACRYDKFEKNLPEIVKLGKLQKGDSQAAATMPWLRKHWITDDGSYHIDLVYVSGNPYVNSKGIGTSFNKYFGEIIDGWDEAFIRSKGRIDPSVLSLFAATAAKDNPNCRFIVHFMQPHAPYLFDKKKPELIDILRRTMSTVVFQKLKPLLPKRIKKTKRHMMEYNYSRLYSNDEIIAAYEKNLRSVKENLLWLINDVFPDKKIVITSDHGEYLGEDGKYGHGGQLTELITSVPILTIR